MRPSPSSITEESIVSTWVGFGFGLGLGFMTYRLAQAPLRAYHATLKFAAVKALVFVTPIQRALLNSVFGGAGPWWLHLAEP